jgi:integrase
MSKKTRNNDLHHLVFRGACWRVRLPLKDGRQNEISTECGKEDLDGAKAFRDRILLPLKIKDQKTAIAVIESMRKTNAENLQDAERAANRLKIADAWEKSPYEESTGLGRNKGIRKLTPLGMVTSRQQWEGFVKWSTGAGFVYMDEIGDKQGQDYSDYIVKTEGLSNETHNKRITTARVMFRGALKTNPFATIGKRKAIVEHKRPLTPAEIQTVWKMLDARIESKAIPYENSKKGKSFKSTKPVDAAEKARRIEEKKLFAVLLFTGLRLSDAIKLKGDNFRDGKIVLKTSKDGKNLEFPVFKVLKPYLGEYPKGGDYVLPLLAGDYLKNGGRSNVIGARIARLFDACGFERTKARENGKRKGSLLGAHAIRYTFVQICFDSKKVPIDDLRRWLGHTCTIITEIYNRNPAASWDRIEEAMSGVNQAGI